MLGMGVLQRDPRNLRMREKPLKLIPIIDHQRVSDLFLPSTASLPHQLSLVVLQIDNRAQQFTAGT